MAEPDDKGDELILELYGSLSSTSAPFTPKVAIERLHRYALSRGFSAKQCLHLINLALFGSKNCGMAEDGIKRRVRPPKTSNAVAILKCVVPAPGVRVSKGAVLSVLATLGPAPGTAIESEAGMADPKAGMGPERTKLDLRVQAAGIRLLSVLLDSPPVPLSVAATLGPEQDARPTAALTSSIPTSYLSLSARTTLDKCYGVLFHFLDYQALRPHLCYLLCKITKHKHVKRYRITKLMALRANTSHEAGLSALLSTYANFYPDLLFPELLGKGGSSEAGRVPGLKYPDTDWLARVLQCHAKHARRVNGETIEPDDDDEAPATKRARVSLTGEGRSSDGIPLPTAAIPNLVTVQPESSLRDTLGSTPSLITELSSLRHLAHSLDRLTLPSQVAAMLGPNYGARLMKVAVLAGATISNDVTLSQGRSTQQAAEDHCWLRLSDWLQSVMREEVGGSQLRPPATSAAMNHLRALLDRAKQLFDMADEIPHRFEATICDALKGLADVAAPDPIVGDAERKAWDETCSMILDFVPLVKPAGWEEIEERLIEPLVRLATAPVLGDRMSAKVLEMAAALLRQWGARNWVRYTKRLARGRTIRWGISNLSSQVDYLGMLSSAIDRLCAAVVQLMGMYPQSVAIEHASLTFYEVLASSFAGLHSTPPPDAAPFWYLATTPTSIMTLSRVCGVMRVVREAYQSLFDGRLQGEPYDEDRPMPYVSTQSTTAMNGSVALMADLIWRGKGLTRVWDGEVNVPAPGYDARVLNELERRCEERGYKFAQITAITHSLVFSNLAERFANTLCTDHTPGPMSAKAVRQAKRSGLPEDWDHHRFRAELLDWLGNRSVDGVRALMTSIMKSLGAKERPVGDMTLDRSQLETAY